MFCDPQRGKCIETSPGGTCAFQDGRTEFDGGCGSNFQVDGLYIDSNNDRIWGRETTAAEKTCHVGPFNTNEPFYAKSCEDEGDCTSCSGLSAITAGSCSAITSQCGPTTEWDDFLSTVDTNNCHVVSFLVKFISTSTPGQQKLLECNVGSTDFPGAFPRYPSSSLSCQVSRASRNLWLDDDEVEQNMCFAAGSDGYEASFVDSDDTGDCETSYSFTELQDKSKTESYRWTPTGDSGVVFQYVDHGIYDADADDYEPPTFRTATPCSSQGDCNVATGKCECASGFHGSACEFPNVDYFV